MMSERKCVVCEAKFLTDHSTRKKCDLHFTPTKPKTIREINESWGKEKSKQSIKPHQQFFYKRMSIQERE